MKYLIILSLLSTLCCINKSDSIAPDSINQNDTLILPFTKDEFYINIKNSGNPFTVKEFDLPIKHECKIILDHIKPWNLPGDFTKLSIKTNSQTTLEIENLEGWVKFNNNYKVPEQVKKQNLLKTDYFIYTKINPEKPILILFGWVYASEPGYMTIIDLSTNQPKLIFNQLFQIQKIVDLDNDGNKEIIGSTYLNDPYTNKESFSTLKFTDKGLILTN